MPKVQSEKKSRFRRIFKKIAYAIFGILCLIGGANLSVGQKLLIDIASDKIYHLFEDEDEAATHKYEEQKHFYNGRYLPVKNPCSNDELK